MQDLKERSKRFALDVILYSRTTSTASNYRATQRAKSRADFVNKMGTVEEEADESLFWLECLKSLATREHAELSRLLKKQTSWFPSSLLQEKERGNKSTI
jgi:four helix bundle protein